MPALRRELCVGDSISTQSITMAASMAMLTAC